MDFLNSSSHKDHSIIDRNKSIISTSKNITPELANELLKFVNPATLATTDLQGRTVQLWSYNSELVASILQEGKITLIPGHKICNSLRPDEIGGELLKRLQKGGLKKWQFAYFKGQLSVWPHLIAAGRNGDPREIPPPFSQRDNISGHIFRNRGDKGHFTRDTPENRAYIQAAVSNSSYKVGTDVYGKEYYLKTMPDGKQSWAIVKDGKIVDGGCNNFPKKWKKDPSHKHGGYLVNTRIEKQSGKTPATEQFRQILQQTKLTESYKSSNPNSTIGPKGGSNGQIGGVGNTTGMIKGLFDSPESIFETEHYFMVPFVQPTDKSQPHLEQSPVFSKEELQQIIRELAIGIYAHDTVPFFSLEFNQEGHLFPVIHPVYQNTLVGRVIGMLDYVMKGYLNGGVFNDRFVDSWADSQKWSRSSALDQMIIFQDYVKKEEVRKANPQGHYLPLKIMIDRYLHNEKMSLEKEVRLDFKGAPDQTREQVERREQKVKEDLEKANPPLFENHTKFSNSFRIIAKQNSFNKKENLFVLDSDFDVAYTLQPDAEYQKRLDAFRKEHGRDPLGYKVLDECCEAMCSQIHTQMKTLPMVQEYFSMLGIINFLSSYFMTLKSHGRVPKLAPIPLSKEDQKKCPALFPELPITSPGKSRLHPSAVIKHLRTKQPKEMVDYLATSAADGLIALSSERPQNLSESSKKILVEEIKKYISHELTKDKRPGEICSAVTGVASSLIAYCSAFAATAINSIPYRRVEYTPPPTRFRPDPLPRFRTAPTTDVTGLTPPQGSTILSDTNFNKEEIIPKFSSGQTQGIALAVLAATGAVTYGIYKGSRQFTAEYAYQQKHYSGESFEDELEKVANGVLEEALLPVFDQITEAQIKSKDKKEILSHRLSEMSKGITHENSLTLDKVIKVLEKGSSDFSPVTTTTIFSDSDPATREVSRSVVGGCGMAIPEKPVIDSEEGQKVLDSYWPTLRKVPPEIWETTRSPENGKKYAGFRLQIDLAHIEQTNYQWMENLLQLEGHDDAKLERFHELLDLISKGQGASSEDEIKKQFLERLKDVASDNYFWKKLNRCVTEKTKDQMGRTLLHGSALFKDVYFSKELLKRGFSANDRDVHGFLPIHYAAMEGHVDQINLLYSWTSGSPLLAQNLSGATPLMVAIQSGQLAAVKALIEMDPFEQSMTLKLAGGYTPLLSALHEGQTDIIHYLLDEKEINPKKVDVNQSTGRGITPLMLAAELKDPEIIQKLLDKRANPNTMDKLGNKALNIAIKHRDRENIRKLSAITSYTKEIGQDIGKYASAELAQMFLTTAPPRVSDIIPMIEEAIEEGNEAVAVTCFNYFKQVEPPIRQIDPPSRQIDPPRRSSESSSYPSISSMSTTRERSVLELLSQEPRFFDSAAFRSSLDSNRIGQERSSRSTETQKEAQNRRLLPLLERALSYNFSELAGTIITHFNVQIELSPENLNLIINLIIRTDGTLLSQLNGINRFHRDIFRSALKYKNSGLLYNLLQFIKVPEQDRPGFKARFGREKSCATIYELPAELKEVQETEGPFAGWTVPHYLVRMDEPHLLFDNFPEEDLLSLRLGGEDGKTLAYIAAEEGNLLALHSLIDKMEESGMPFDRQYQGKHLLYGAFESFQDDVIDRAICLFQKQINIPLDLATGVRAVHLAAEKNLVDVLKQIGNYRADFYALDNDGRSPLYYAIKSGSSEAVDFLLTKKRPITRENYPITEEDMRKAQSITNDDAKEILQKLLKAGGTFPPPQTSTVRILDDIELDRLTPFFEAIENQTLGRISEDGIMTIPLERTLPETHTKVQKPLPIIFDLVHRCMRDNLMSIDQLFKFITIAQRQNPDLIDAEGNTFSHYFVQLDIPDDFKIPEEVTRSFNAHLKNSHGTTPLHLAAAVSSAKTFENLLKLPGLNLDIEDNDGETPLFYAIKQGNLAAVNALIAKGANPNHRNHRHLTPLFVAGSFTEKKNSQIIKKLLSVCDIEKYCSNAKINPLYLLAHKDPDGLFIEALSKTAYLTYSEDRRSGIAHVLAQEGNLKALRFLAYKDKKAVLAADERDIYPWDRAAYKGEIDVLIFYKEIYPQLFTTNHNGKADKMLQGAAQGGQKKTAKWLVDQGVLEHMDRKKTKDVLRAASISNSPETFKFFADLFMKMGGDHFIPTGAFEILPSMVAHESINSLEHLYTDLKFPKDSEAIYPGHGVIGTGLQLAAGSGAFKSTKWLLSHGEDPQKVVQNNRMHLLEIGAKNSSFAQFRHLLETVEFPIDFQNEEDEQTLLHIAATHGNLQHVALLIDKGWDLNVRDRYRLTGLDRAIVERRADIARVLMLCGADEESIHHARGILDNTLDTDLEKTLELYHETKEMFNTFDAVRMRNLQTSSGETNLHLAIRLNCKTSTLLLSKTDLLDIPDARSNTPLHIAVAEKNLALARILIDNGASLELRNARGLTSFDLAIESGDATVRSFFAHLMNVERGALA